MRALVILMIFSLSQPALALQASDIFYARIQNEPYNQVFRSIPLRPHAVQALDQLYASKTLSTRIRWSRQKLAETATQLDRALARHGLSVLRPLSQLFSENHNSFLQDSYRYEEEIVLSAALINIIDRFINGHMLSSSSKEALNSKEQVNRLKTAVMAFHWAASVESFFFHRQPRWSLYSAAQEALREVHGWRSTLVNLQSQINYGECSKELDVIAQILARFDFGDYQELTKVKSDLDQNNSPPESYSRRPGDNSNPNKVTPCFDEDLLRAIDKFQYQTGLPTTGNLDLQTISRMRRLLKDWENTISINMDRMRWRTLVEGGPMVLVNVPDFHLYAFRDGSLELAMKVVVGDEVNSTPMFEDAIEYLVFRPSWWVPESIVQNEIIDLVLKDPLYLEKYGFIATLNGRTVSGPELARYASRSGSHLRRVAMTQLPGPYNVLGHVKFIFPNPMNIYLHDTPDEYLFDHDDRTFSHGCIRVEKPAELVKFLLLGKPGFNVLNSKFLGVNGPENQRVNINPPVPIQIVYWTVRLNANGKLAYADDVYKYDKVAIRSFYEVSNLE